MAETPSLVVNEIFGPTLQGEGPSTGQRATFLRLGGCPLRCVWCDTKYTWDWEHHDAVKELKAMPFAEIWGRLGECGLTHETRLLVITGGEPMAQAEHLEEFLWEIPDVNNLRVEIETSGIFPPMRTLSFVHYNVSPKLENSGNPRDKRFNYTSLKALLETRRAIFKFVVTSEEDLREIVNLQLLVGIPDHLMWIQPEGVEAAHIIESLQTWGSRVVNLGFNISPRLHVLIWGNVRGR